MTGTSASERQTGRSIGWPALAAAALILGQLLPWLTVDLDGRSQGYSPFDLPVLDVVCVVWTIVLLAWLVVPLRTTSRRGWWIIGTGAFVLSSIAAGLIVLLARWSSRRIPLFLLPEEAKAYVPTIRVDAGLPVIVAGCFVGAVGFAIGALRRPSPARSENASTAPAVFPRPKSSDEDIWRPSGIPSAPAEDDPW
jgi:hypothetical protein